MSTQFDDPTVRTTTRDFVAVNVQDISAITDRVAHIVGCPVSEDEVRGFVGRNDNLLMSLSDGRQVLVKRLLGPADSIRQRLESTIAFEEGHARGAELSFRTPHFYGSDDELALLVYEYLPESLTVQEILSRGWLDEDHAGDLGRMVADIHRLQTARDAAHPARSANSFYALSVEDFANCSGAETEAWSLLQHDRRVVEAMKSLRTMSEEAPRRPVHADLRLDQFVLKDDVTYLVDWEEFRLGDPAIDVGTVIGEFLHFGAAGLFKDLDVDPSLAPGAAHEALMAQGASHLAEVEPLVTAFWRAYRDTAEPDADLAVRATAYAGWHFFDRLLSGALHGAMLSAADRGLAGIGRGALIDPEHFVPSLGLTQE
ncbi:class V lanthionine synthetase subunit LxmK [Flexivirga sp. B27]